jgi:hypothetical protein
LALLVAKAEAVQDLVSKRHGSIVVHERTAHSHHVHVADVFAGLGVAVKDRETVQIGSRWSFFTGAGPVNPEAARLAHDARRSSTRATDEPR